MVSFLFRTDSATVKRSCRFLISLLNISHERCNTLSVDRQKILIDSFHLKIAHDIIPIKTHTYSLLTIIVEIIASNPQRLSLCVYDLKIWKMELRNAPPSRCWVDSISVYLWSWSLDGTHSKPSSSSIYYIPLPASFGHELSPPKHTQQNPVF